MSASPLAGRGLPLDLAVGDDRLNNSLDSEADTLGIIDDLGGDSYSLQDEQQQTAMHAVEMENLDQESVNFVEFIKTQIVQHEDDQSKGKHGNDEIAFTTLLPPNKTSAVVATQGLMHVLVLATKGVLEVQQDEYESRTGDDGDGDGYASYHVGEIFVGLRR